MNPVGPERPSTYWKRRALALVALLLLVALIVLGIGALTDGGDDAATSASPSASPSMSGATTPGATTTSSTAGATASASNTATGAVGACNPADIVVTATTDKDSYPVTGSARVGLTIQSKASTDCSMDVGSQALELVISSGSDRIWSSDDCQGTPTPRTAVVKPGNASQIRSNVTWNLARSTPGCGSTATPVKVGVGTYNLVARAGDIRSAPKTFQLTGN